MVGLQQREARVSLCPYQRPHAIHAKRINNKKFLTFEDLFPAEDACALSGECVGEHETCITTGLYSECVCDEGYVGHDCDGTSLNKQIIGTNQME